MGQQDHDPTDRSFTTLNELPGFPDFPDGLDADVFSALPTLPTSEQTPFAPGGNTLSQSADGEENQTRQTAILNLLAQLRAPSMSNQQPETSTANQIPEPHSDDLKANAAAPAPSPDKAAEPSHPFQDTLSGPDASSEQSFPLQLTNENLTNFNFIVPSEAELALGLLPGQTMVPMPDGLETAVLQQTEVSRILVSLPSPQPEKS